MSGSEMLFYGGICIMAAAAAAAILSVILFRFTGRRLKRKLEQEYGRPYR